MKTRNEIIIKPPFCGLFRRSALFAMLPPFCGLFAMLRRRRSPFVSSLRCRPLCAQPLLSLFLISSIAPFFLACEKELDMEYRTVDPIYVVEGLVTQDGTTVKVSTTRSVTANDRESYNVNNAVIVLTSEAGDEDTLSLLSAGRYVSSVYGVPGVRYWLDVEVDGHRFNASSVMQQLPQVNSFSFVWRKIVTEDFLFAKLNLQDFPDENNYYFMHVYRNYIGYRWAVLRDKKNPGGELQQLFNCSSRKKVEDLNDDDALHEGDFISVEIRNIDRQTYDYFFSMQQMGSTGTNPTEVFTGGCLGYFSACGVANYRCYFHLSDVETEEE